MRSNHLPDYFDVVDDDSRPGEVLHPGETPVDRGNHPVKQGHTLDVYIEANADDVARTSVEVIDDDEGDLIAIPDDETPLTASRLYRITADLRRFSVGNVYGVPSYDAETGDLTVTREVKKSSDMENRIIVEVRTRGGKQSWALGRQSTL